MSDPDSPLGSDDAQNQTLFLLSSFYDLNSDPQKRKQFLEAGLERQKNPEVREVLELAYMRLRNDSANGL